MQPYPLQEGEEVLWAGSPRRPRKWLPEYAQMIAVAAAIVFLIVIGGGLAG
ncbi:hypothetical protein [Amycolatopsis sp. BJA-103]|uniref:hypothetical protein n=1 Tax=Amycolatopsis sp. BJA-103 TaxID=1911175 RepID=UPI001E633734|nr:hypothetical protein [Amycolatopsis sp. BJA-103]